MLPQCWSHKLSLVELAFDFAPKNGVNEKFVLQHGIFRRSRRGPLGRSLGTWFGLTPDGDPMVLRDI